MAPDDRQRPPLRAAVLTISTSKTAGRGEDLSGPELAAFAERLGAEVIARELVADDQAGIAERLRHWADGDGCELILTSGGTGFSPDDVTPEATRAVLEREAPGIGEAMRAASREHTKHWALSRGVAGVRGHTLIINFPGNPPSIRQAGAALVETLPHALRLLARPMPEESGDALT